MDERELRFLWQWVLILLILSWSMLRRRFWLVIAKLILFCTNCPLTISNSNTVFITVLAILLSLLKLTHSWRRSLQYRNQFIDLLRRSLDCFLYDLRHERVKLCSPLFSHNIGIFLFQIYLFTRLESRHIHYFCLQSFNTTNISRFEK